MTVLNRQLSQVQCTCVDHHHLLPYIHAIQCTLSHGVLLLNCLSSGLTAVDNDIQYLFCHLACLQQENPFYAAKRADGGGRDGKHADTKHKGAKKK